MNSEKLAYMTAEKTTMKTVLITGTSSGIGKACALHLDKLGYRVFAGVRKPAGGEALQKVASARLTPVMFDVTDEDSIACAREIIAGEVGINDTFSLVNNAGFGLAGPIEFQPLEDFRQQMEVNFIGVVAVTQAFIPLLRQSHGRIVNIGSISGINAMPFQSAYCATKFALEAFTDALRVELRPWGVSVSIVQPGDIQTPAWKKGLTAADKMLTTWPPEAFALYGPIVEMMKKMAQSERGLPADEVAKVVAQLLSESTPRTRVQVGTDAKLLTFIESLPTPLRDWLIFRQLPKYG
jgi:NAD(P)-dependent dehydrogenase (short-subunit alcohol dehydrogenase family)